MTISVFDPFGQHSESELDGWLAQRNRTPDDEAILDYLIPLSGLFSTAIGPGTRLRIAPRAVRSWFLGRPGRSRRGRLGLHECDLIAALEHTLWWQVLAARAAVVLLTAVLCLLLEMPGVALVALPAMAWAATGWRPPYAVLFCAAVLSWTAWHDLSLLTLGVPLAAFAVLVRLVLSLLKAGAFSQAPASSPVSFLGRFFLLRALWDRTAACVVLAVDKATHDDRVRSGLFADEVHDRVPTRLRPVLLQCRAMVAVAGLDFQSAMMLSEEARALAAGGPPEIRGWCALQAGDVLLAAGQPAAAETRWQEADSLLAAVRRARFWAGEAELRMAEALTGDPADRARCVRGLQVLCRTRSAAVRSGNLALLGRTELHLLRLMHAAGNTVGVVEQLDREYGQRKGLADVGASVGEHAAETMLLATLYLDIIEYPDRYPDTLRVDEEGQHERCTHAAAMVNGVLRQLSRSTMPLLEAQAFAVLARIQQVVEMREEALGNALESLNAVQHVRYQLPTTQWRARWVAVHAHSYGLALDLAADDPELVAELLEVIRSQSVPLDSDEPSNAVRSVLDTLVSSTGLPPAPDLPTDGRTPYHQTSSDPLLTDRTILVRHASYVGGVLGTAVDLDGELDVMFPGAWYWSYARVGDWLYHAVRTPSGRWHSERTPHQDFVDSYRDLVSHLPVRLPGLKRPGLRLQGSALMALTADHPVRASALSAGQVWDRIFDGLGAAMLPTVLKDALDNAETPAELVLAPTGALAVVPVSALSITPGVPLMDVAQVSYLPSIALLSQRRRRTLHEVVDRLDSPPRQLTPVLAVLAPRWAPDDENQDLPHAVSGAPQDSERVTGPLVKRDLVNLLAHPHSSERILYLAGHVKGPATSDPGAMGFEFSDGSLTLHDFYRNDSTGAPLYRLPRRIILAACSSLGLHGDAESGYAPSLVDAPEWLGMGAAVIHSGAQQVYCTLFKIPDSEHATRIGNALADALQRDLDPPAALRAVQRAELRRWKDSDGSLPLVFLAYAYVGLGQGRGKELLSPPDDVPVPVQVPAREPMQVPAPEPVKVAAVTPQPRPHETSEKPFMMMSRHGPGEEKFADLRNPRFLPDSRLRRSTFDGEVAGPVVLRAARYNTEPFHALNTCEWRFMRSRLFLTDARLVVLVDKRDRQGRRFAGHIRYPWISAVGFRPQQGILDECELLIEIHQDDVGPRRLTLLLQKDTDSGELAQQLVRRIAGHHLDHGELPDAVVPSFEALRDAPRLLAPIKGQHATYWLDAYKSFPYGTEYVLDRPVEGTWIGPGVGRSG